MATTSEAAKVVTSGAGGAGAGGDGAAAAAGATAIASSDGSRREWDERLVLRAVQLARDAVEHGNHPFGALLANESGEIVLEGENCVVTEKDVTGHAETALVRKASKTLDHATFPGLTLYTSTEPCAMCAGAIYWAGIGRVVYGCSEEVLYTMTGAHEENPTFLLPCRKVFAHGQRKVEVVGPVREDEARKVHIGFWVQEPTE